MTVKIADYWKDYPKGSPEYNDLYSEGPFVVCLTCFHTYRLEVQGPKMPIIPDLSIYDYLKKRKLPPIVCFPTVTKPQESAEALNQAVKEGTIVKNNMGSWYWNQAN